MVSLIFQSVLFNNAVKCQDYIELVIDEWMSMEYWWNDTDGGKTEVLGNLSQCHFIQHKSNVDWPGIEIWSL